jgi:hypothetical protein
LLKLSATQRLTELMLRKQDVGLMRRNNGRPIYWRTSGSGSVRLDERRLTAF